MITETALSTTTRAIENDFPIGFISKLAEQESWRKEVYRPIYYMHKWWARRLGSVFRAIIIASCVKEQEDVERLFYEKVQFPEITVFDPFMGSGTTIGEAVKLGCHTIGRDINPVSAFMVRTALQGYSRTEVEHTFRHLEAVVGNHIRSFYKTVLPNGQEAEALYYFWVKVVPCPLCGRDVELFKRRIFAQNAMYQKHPEAKAICPACSTISDVTYNQATVTCLSCGSAYNPQCGTVTGNKATCPACHAKFKVIDVVRRLGAPPDHRMYAKLVLTADGEKLYLITDQFDESSYNEANLLLDTLRDHIPSIEILPGYNTNQVLNYNYKYWHQMFNARQLVCLTLLAREIQKIEKQELRLLFSCLFSGTLEFNNMFASFKGEGTGAVRHMFSHHILKPELMPLEANVWGTPKSSGSFSTLFESRMLRALDYKDDPFEVQTLEKHGRKSTQKVFGLSTPINKTVADDYAAFSSNDVVYLSCGDSSETDIQDQSVDLVITDPPFFDNVHYSQLADFFYVWLRQILGEQRFFSNTTTRSAREVQSTEVEEFADKLASVFSECYRVLKDDGLLIFTYHHSRTEGWAAVYRAIREAGFFVRRAHPVKAEMAVSVPLQQSHIPVNFDLIFVCQKGKPSHAQCVNHDSIPLLACSSDAKRAVKEFQKQHVPANLGDVKIMLMGSVLSRLPAMDSLGDETQLIYDLEHRVDLLAKEIIATTVQ